jgi:sugar (pentulose or hexulose) kinase
VSVEQTALLGLDVGTTGVRAAVFDARGRVLAQASEDCLYEAPCPGWAEADSSLWWRAVCAVTRRVARETSLAAVSAVGVTGQAPTLVLVGSNAEVLHRAILWLDVRSDAEARAIDAALGPGGAEAIGGNRMHAYYLGPKFAWMRRHHAEIVDRTAFVLQSHAWVVFQLTGEAACDLSTAMLCSPLFDARSLAWSDGGARVVGIPMRALPRIVRAHDVVGAVTRAAATATGLREGTPVVSGGGDFAASALGAGVFDEGQACLMLGTAGNLLMPMAAPRFDPRLINSHHVGCDRWLALGGTLCGAALEWFRGACAPGVPWESLEAEARAIDVDELAGLTVLPYFQGERTPIWDEGARGVIAGIDRTHRRGHLYRALLEGVALGFRHCLAVAEENGASFGEVVAANGAGKSALFRQILSDALGLPLTWRAGSDAGHGTVAGAAILGGIGAGVLAGAEAARSWLDEAGPGRGAAVRHEPDARSHARLAEVFARRGGLIAMAGNRAIRD